jgi:hypothetical protein
MLLCIGLRAVAEVRNYCRVNISSRNVFWKWMFHMFHIVNDNSFFTKSCPPHHKGYDVRKRFSPSLQVFQEIFQLIIHQCIWSLFILKPKPGYEWIIWIFTLLSKVVHYAMALLVSWVHSSEQVRQALFAAPQFSTWLQRLVLEDPEPAVRREVCTALYRLCLGSSSSPAPAANSSLNVTSHMLGHLMEYLVVAESMRPQKLEVSTAWIQPLFIENHQFRWYRVNDP